MDVISICLIGVGLAMDCFAVSITKGMTSKKHHLKRALKMALLFGFFQAIMPLIGYGAGFKFADLMSDFDHWIAFGLLGIIGVKMVIEGLKPHEEFCPVKEKHAFHFSKLIPLAFATSIDALATGIVLVPYPDTVWLAISLIGLISFVFAFVGMYIGIHFGKRFNIRVELIGGLILVGIGMKILFEHLFYN